MSQLMHTYSTLVRDVRGTMYQARVYGDQRLDGTWTGWLEFYPLFADAPILRTGQETSQPDRDALEYWAGGLEPIYLDGALQRAFAE